MNRNTALVTLKGRIVGMPVLATTADGTPELTLAVGVIAGPRITPLTVRLVGNEAPGLAPKLHDNDVVAATGSLMFDRSRGDAIYVLADTVQPVAPAWKWPPAAWERR